MDEDEGEMSPKNRRVVRELLVLLSMLMVIAAYCVCYLQSILYGTNVVHLCILILTTVCYTMLVAIDHNPLAQHPRTRRSTACWSIAPVMLVALSATLLGFGLTEAAYHRIMEHNNYIANLVLTQGALNLGATVLIYMRSFIADHPLPKTRATRGP